MFNEYLHLILHALEHSLQILPIIFVCYLLIELLEDKIWNKYQTSKMLKGKFAPVVSAGFGLIPQCGFSVVATDLYSKKILTIGSLMAIYIATSDEALPLLLTSSNNYLDILLIIIIKFVYAVLVGLIFDSIFRRKELNSGTVEMDTQHSHHSLQGCCHHDIESKHKNISDIFIHPLIHSLKIFGFILIINIFFEFLIYFVGENSIQNFMYQTGFFQPFIVAFVGLIPNCFSSILITQFFIDGMISFGSCIAGLCVNSGIALIVLFKLNRNLKENLFILISLYFLGVVLGIFLNLFI